MPRRFSQCGFSFPLLLCLTAFLAGAWGEDRRRPNIVVFITDDLTVTDITPYGSKKTRTPNMQRLADAGMTFTQAFVASPSCAPSRAALLTGLMPSRNGAEANHSKARADVRKLPPMFAELGYQVAAFGKVAHYNHNRDYGIEQTSFEGFHDHRGIPAAVEYLQKWDKSKPLCLFVGTNWPHRPWPNKAEGYDAAGVKIPPQQLDTPDTREFRARYLTAVSMADDDLGKVYDAARSALGDNTIFVCSSDHGAQWPFSKWSCYEDGIRSVLIASWPGMVKPGSRSAALVSWVDILPSLLQAAGGAPPEPGLGAGQIDGRSFLPVLRGEREEHRERIFAAHSSDGKMNVYPTRVVRDREWKYIRNLHPEYRFTTHIDLAEVADETAYFRSWEKAAAAGDARAKELVEHYHQHPGEELYDLRNDPFEQHNLAADQKHAERLTIMRRQLDAWMKEQGDEGRVIGTPKLLAAAKDTAAAPAATKPAPRDAGQKPNIIFVLTDDMGFGDLGCYGGTIQATPNIDRLAAEGTKFMRYYSASPICSPSRAGILTGMAPARWNITSYLQTKKGNRGCEQADFLSTKAPTIPRRLKSVGYATAHFGKWHLGGGRDVTDAPKFAAYGYDEHAGTYESPEPHPDITATDWIWSDKDKVKRWERSQFFVDKTLDFLRRHKDQPSFVNVWLDDPHTPWVPSAAAGKGDNKLESLRGVLAENDRQIGRLLDGLKELGIDQNTLLMFVSDNGPLPTFEGKRGNGLRASKLSLYEGGIRLPCIARWPGKVPAGRVDEETTFSALDFFPTFAAIAGAELPNRKFDGQDMSAALRGTSQTRKEPLFWEYGRNNEFFAFPKPPGTRSPNVAVRDEKWKLLVNADGSNAELYDVIADPFEKQNVIEKESAVADQLKARALEWRRSLPAPPKGE